MAITHELKGGKLIITVDVSDAAIEKAPLSSKGKNKLVASTGSFLRVNERLSFGLNVIAKKEAAE